MRDADTMPPIMLHCPDCDREMMAQRDATDPPTAAVMRIQCDRCDDGDSHAPEYFDAAGSWIDPVAHLLTKGEGHGARAG